MEELPPPAFWHSRGYLPHFDGPGQLQALTFRLADSVPSKVLASWRAELGLVTGDNPTLRRRIATYEDSGHGSCLLRFEANAAIVASCLLRADGQRYRLLEWCIMPNHVHALIEPLDGIRLGNIVRTWKTYSAREINRRHQRSGALWEAEYHDRYIRDQTHYEAAKAYIRENPVKAGLCGVAGEWRWSSTFESG
ncbi:transposase [Haloferula sp. BvORR071]|uniref:REP-associated tyrosine transposase n=1 Tax=Haloferula sp. BvORR071 TaxID=1396141 RepID=UPI00054F3CEC|nr:transposase [Haloferula sp. BvORR071]